MRYTKKHHQMTLTLDGEGVVRGWDNNEWPADLIESERFFEGIDVVGLVETDEDMYGIGPQYIHYVVVDYSDTAAIAVHVHDVPEGTDLATVVEEVKTALHFERGLENIPDGLDYCCYSTFELVYSRMIDSDAVVVLTVDWEVS